MTAVDRWEFICDGRTWTWRFGTSTHGPFSSLDAATVSAASHGFDPNTQYWTATIAGRTTHCRPGKPTVNLPSGMEP
jgi:hypothetical protein